MSPGSSVSVLQSPPPLHRSFRQLESKELKLSVFVQTYVLTEQGKRGKKSFFEGETNARRV